VAKEYPDMKEGETVEEYKQRIDRKYNKPAVHHNHAKPNKAKIRKKNKSAGKSRQKNRK